MSIKTLFVAWQDRVKTRGWYPIGRLHVDAEKMLYTFCYIQGAKEAQAKAEFQPLLDFPRFEKEYTDSRLFPFFQNRVVAATRPDFKEYLSNLGLSAADANPIQILAVSGGERTTDAFEVFPKFEKREDGNLCCRFFLHGNRHLSPNSIERVDKLTPREKLRCAMEWGNPATGQALQIQTADYCMIGWAPRYLVGELDAIIKEYPDEFDLHVVQVNPSPAPMKQRLLIEFCSKWPEREPMSSDDFKPLV